MRSDTNRFIGLELSEDTLDIYGVRTSIVKALMEVKPQLQGTLLDVGCGQMPYRKLIESTGRIKKYIGLDLEASSIHNTAHADLFWDGKTIPLVDNSIDCAIATEVFEHCFDVEIVMKEILRVLKPGGILFFTVPFLWPLHETPYDAYRYTPFSLSRSLWNSGFNQIDLKALGGWDASLAQMIGLWVKRRPLRMLKRKLISFFAVFLLRILYKHDSQPVNFKESTMLTGISGTAIKPFKCS